MFDFNKPNIEITDVSDDKKYGRFVVEPLERGYGTTLGNSLRRIMLSSLPGAAISSVKIDGVLHEFSSIPGVKEDVTEIIMNLKSLAIKNTSESDEVKTAYIEYEASPFFFTSFASSFLRSSVSSGNTRRIEVPSFVGLIPISEVRIAFSIAFSMLFSHG